LKAARTGGRDRKNIVGHWNAAAIVPLLRPMWARHLKSQKQASFCPSKNTAYKILLYLIGHALKDTDVSVALFP